MKTTNEKLAAWAVNKTKNEYKNDVCLVIGHDTYRLEKDKDGPTISYFIPANEKVVGLAKTPVIGGVSYDFFPMPWERLERIAGLDEDNSAVLLDVEILYYRNDQDKTRFMDLQTKLKGNLKNPAYTLNKALEKLNIAMELNQTMMFEDALYKVRKAAGHIAGYLSCAVAYVNGTYFKGNPYYPFADLKTIKSKPKNFIELYEVIVKAKTADELKKLCHEIIRATREFLSVKKRTGDKPHHLTGYENLAGWYEELSYAWREIYHWCDQQDAANAFMRGCFLQSELDVVLEEHGLDEMDLLGAFNANDLSAYRKRAEKLEKQFLAIIKEHGGKVDTYDTIDEFLKKN
jgi:hypothetical protein